MLHRSKTLEKWYRFLLLGGCKFILIGLIRKMTQFNLLGVITVENTYFKDFKRTKIRKIIS